MKRIICTMLALFMLVSCLNGCDKAEDTAKTKDEAQTENGNVDRYFLYVEDNKLNRLDVETEIVKEITLDIPVDGVVNAIICDKSKSMIAMVNNAKTADKGLVHYYEGSDETTYLGDNTELIRISNDGRIVFYLEKVDEQKALYRFDAKKGTIKKLAEDVHAVSVSDDGKRAFVSIIEDANTGEGTLCYSENGIDLDKIADNIMLTSVNVSQDCSAAVYWKMDERNLEKPMLSPVYIWSKEGFAKGKEQKLPFDANEIVIFDENNIYYTQPEMGYTRTAHYYYDGRDSHVLTQDGSSHGHKAGNYMYYYREGNGDEYTKYVVYKGEKVETNIYFCALAGYMAFVSPDDKCLYGWSDSGMMYRLELNAKGQMEETPLRQTDGFSPRKMECRGESIIYPREGTLFLNDEELTDEYADQRLSTLGDAVVYMNGENICYYTDGKTTVYEGHGSADAVCPAKGNKVAVFEEGGGITLLYTKAGETKSVTFGERASQFVLVYTWSYTELGNYPMSDERTGAWFQRDCGSLVWRR